MSASWALQGPGISVLSPGVSTCPPPPPASIQLSPLQCLVPRLRPLCLFSGGFTMFLSDSSSQPGNSLTETRGPLWAHLCISCLLGVCLSELLSRGQSDFCLAPCSDSFYVSQLAEIEKFHTTCDLEPGRGDKRCSEFCTVFPGAFLSPWFVCVTAILDPVRPFWIQGSRLSGGTCWVARPLSVSDL